MMIVDAVKGLDVERDSGVHRESLKPLIDQLGVKAPNLVAGECRPKHQEGAPRHVDSDPGQRLIHRQTHIGIASDAFHVAKSLFHRLSERNPDIFGGMVMIDMQVTRGLHGDVDSGVPGKQIEHVVKKADPGRNRCNATAVKINRDGDVGFLGSALYRCLAHIRSLRARFPRRVVTGV